MVTNNRCAAEQINGDQMENIATDKKLTNKVSGTVKIPRSSLMDGVNIGNFGTSDNSEINEERRNREEKELCAN